MHIQSANDWKESSVWFSVTSEFHVEISKSDLPTYKNDIIMVGISEEQKIDITFKKKWGCKVKLSDTIIKFMIYEIDMYIT